MKFSIKPKLYTRYFNSLIEHGDYLEKRSYKKEKLKQEFDFYNQLPPEIKSYFPDVHTFEEISGFASYMIKKIDVLDASYMMFEKHLYSEYAIRDLITSLAIYLDKVPKRTVSRDDFIANLNREIIKKNRERVEELNRLRESADFNQICFQAGFQDLNHYLQEINSRLVAVLSSEMCDTLYFSHGDLCFSNLLIEGTDLYLIDPKGAADPAENFRLIHYELAKISQSLLGNYDRINHELFNANGLDIEWSVDIPEPALGRMEFEKLVKNHKTSLKAVRLVEASLFLSLIPFHKESSKKMKAFLINSLNIFKENL